MTAVLLGVFIFVMAAVADVLWQKWTLESNRHNSIRASIWAALIPLAGVWSIDGYLHSLWYVIPVMAGCALGTYVSNRKDKRANQPG